MRVYFHIARVALCVFTVWLCMFDFDYWWAGGVPWIILCWPGIAMTVPFVILYCVGMGAAQVDATSDEFLIFLIFVMPTLLTILASEIWHRYKDKLVTKRG